ncbi:mitochondrial import inner membrane translocase subunit TIM16, putative (PAM16) [Plasmodium ovale curtisi]|uniref:Mitochondrial import inner membrane translocase subunit TIM16, putative (PAM16) n=1 Tax=Plasmodium ovale curtisi TaxID=864141 RepID=A0A1A8WIW6_PLAOA|nr:mitochondrial import inner membrane translocase subunit TIM16, putative (PAM16) [Plasmodium ovale curtisi]SBS92894.1 mitochondrial import inner membrane translocase subunit TIM16, putative (PAM16) [Plasmodium ovale curtisi]
MMHVLASKDAHSAYKEIIKNKHNTNFIKEKYNSCMNIEEALNILNVDRNKVYKKMTKEELMSLKEEIHNRHLVLYKLNEKCGPYNGSVYIQKKAKVAKDILFQHLKLQ